MSKLRNLGSNNRSRLIFLLILSYCLVYFLGDVWEYILHPQSCMTGTQIKQIINNTSELRWITCVLTWKSMACTDPLMTKEKSRSNMCIIQEIIHWKLRLCIYNSSQLLNHWYYSIKHCGIYKMKAKNGLIERNLVWSGEHALQRKTSSKDLAYNGRHLVVMNGTRHH